MSAAAARPALHLTPRSGWLNDPLALTWREDEHGGRYHLFFQHVPDGTTWAAHCGWGHATSTDLLHWDEQPPALPPALDELGAWSGCLVEGRILYTSVLSGQIERGRVRAAYAEDDDWQRWVPGDIVLEPPADPAVHYFRDPFVWRDGDWWRMLVGAGLADGTGCALGYRSEDLEVWEATGVVAARRTDERSPVWTGAIWECPQLLRLPDADVLVVSPADAAQPGDVVAATGSMRGGRFEVARWQRLTSGAPYASSVFVDREGAPGMVTWLRGVAGQGWAGAVSAPLLVGLEGGRVALDLHPAVQEQRRPWDPEATCWEVEWAGAGRLSLVEAAGAVAAVVDATAEGVQLTVGDTRLALDRGARSDAPVRILRDGPVLQVLAAGQLAATAITPVTLRPEGRGWQGWALA